MTQPSTDIEARVAQIAAATGKSPDDVRDILTALDVGAGEPVGTLRYNQSTKEFAHRVMDRGTIKWRISHPTDGVSYETSTPLAARLSPTDVARLPGGVEWLPLSAPIADDNQEG